MVQNFQKKSIDVFGDIIMGDLVPDFPDVLQVISSIDNIEFLQEVGAVYHGLDVFLK